MNMSSIMPLGFTHRDTSHNQAIPSEQDLNETQLIILHQRALVCNKKFLNLQNQSGYQMVKTQERDGNNVIHTMP
jgi:hypothetical protein